ncbi:MAG: divalent-cation tolerance protein CutA [Fibrobacteria bacterium]|nr:divalent-cation tolerance protein CutA [Fibrobacteria bacterium]
MILWVPCPDQATAERLGEDAVGLRHAASANVLPGMVSVFRWKGSMRKVDECLLVLHTIEERSADLRSYLERSHPYEIPAISQLEVSTLSPSFSAWIRAETAPPLA